MGLGDIDLIANLVVERMILAKPKPVKTHACIYCKGDLFFDLTFTKLGLFCHESGEWKCFQCGRTLNNTIETGWVKEFSSSIRDEPGE